MSSFPKDELTHLYDSTTRWKKLSALSTWPTKAVAANKAKLALLCQGVPPHLGCHISATLMHLGVNPWAWAVPKLISGSAMISIWRIQLWQVYEDCIYWYAMLTFLSWRAYMQLPEMLTGWRGFSWTLHQNEYRHWQCISWTSHICSRGFPDSPFERNNHDGDIIMVFSSIPLRYI